MKYLLLLLAFPVYAHDHGHDYETPRTPLNLSIKGSDTAASVAMSQSHMDWATQKWQWSVGMGHVDNSTATAFSIGKKFCESCPLINFSIGSGEHTATGIGLNGRF